MSWEQPTYDEAINALLSLDSITPTVLVRRAVIDAILENDKHDQEAWELELALQVRKNVNDSLRRAVVEEQRRVDDALRDLEVSENYASDLAERLWRAEKRLEATETELMETRATFDALWAAQVRALDLWLQDHPDQEFYFPDHQQLVTWMLGKIAELTAVNDLLTTTLDALPKKLTGQEVSEFLHAPRWYNKPGEKII